MSSNCFVPSLLAKGITKTNDGVPLGLLNWMIHNRIATNAPLIAKDCRVSKVIVKPYWLNLEVGDRCIQCCDVR